MLGVSPVRTTALLVASLTGLAGPAVAQQDTATGYDKVWAKARLYTGDDDSFFQSVQLSGRLQLDLAWEQIDRIDDQRPHPRPRKNLFYNDGSAKKKRNTQTDDGENLGQRILVTDISEEEKAEQFLRALVAVDRIIHKEKTVFAANAEDPAETATETRQADYFGTRPALD